mmetsp:Transcript_70813/g.166184  ORF Transcript_70813/g.166184 Transcript_70813/m.166184 type:complete len:414 (-) Transcript_70813:110-1351(-)
MLGHDVGRFSGFSACFALRSLGSLPWQPDWVSCADWAFSWLPALFILLPFYGLRRVSVANPAVCYISDRSLDSPTAKLSFDALLFHFGVLQDILEASGSLTAARLSTGNQSLHEGVSQRLQKMHREKIACQPNIYYIGGRHIRNHHQPHDDVHRLNVQWKDWARVSSLPGPRWASSCAILKEEILVMGGYSEGQDVASVDCFNPVLSSWRHPLHLRLTCPRSMSAAASLEGRVYLVAGTSCGRELDLFQRCDGTGWESLPQLPVPRLGCCAAAAGGMIYVVGGFSRGHALRCLECFNMREWKTLEPPSVARWSAAAVALHGKIYVFGGYNGGTPLSTAERFNPFYDVWETIPRLPTPRKHLVAVRANDSVYVMGGFDGEASTAVVERFSLKKGWEQSKPMPVPSEWGVAAAMP